MDTVLSHPAYAKINLHLAVGLPYPDGYHPIQSLFALVSLHDQIEVEWRDGTTFSVEVDGLGAYCKDGTDTLTQAARLWHEAGGESGHLKVRVHKQIPVKAGLGGGSSDAAALLKLLQEIGRNRSLNDDDFSAIAQKVGSDVPFFLSSHHCAVVTGRGERVVSMNLRKLSVLLVMPTYFDVSTASAYRALDEMTGRNGNGMLEEQALCWMLEQPTSEWKQWFFNDFLSCVGNDSYYATLFALSSAHAGYASLSGSGACWFFISEKDEEVVAVKMKIEQELGTQVRCWITSTFSNRK